MFYTVERTDVCNFADETTPHSIHHNLKEAMTKVEHDYTILAEWSRDNFMTLNAEKYYLLASGYKEEMMSPKILDAQIWEEYIAKVRGILIGSDLSFDNHAKMINKKASEKLTAISRMTDIISIKEQ